MLGQLIAAEQTVLLSDSDGTVDSLGCKVSLKRHTSVKGLMLKISLYMSKGLITSYMLRTLAGMLVPWKMQKGCIRLVWHGRCETCKLLSSTLHVAGLPRALFGSWLRIKSSHTANWHPWLAENRYPVLQSGALRFLRPGLHN